MTKEFHWGIIGPGRIAKKFSQAVHATPGSSIYAIASRSSQDLESLRKTMGASKAYRRYEELVQDANVDAVYIATPHNYHFENAQLCLSYQKPALVEKPFTVNAAETKELIHLAKKNGAFLMEALWTRFLPIYKEVRKWLDKNSIGEVRFVHSTLGFVTRRDSKDRLLNPNLAGGTILDLGVYNMAASQFVFQKQPEAIAAVGYLGHTGVDEATSVSMDYGGGVLSHFACSYQTRLPGQMEIYGSEGYILIHATFNKAEAATLSAGNRPKTVRKPMRINGFEYEIEEAQKRIRAGEIESPSMTHQNTLENMQAMDQIRAIIGLRYPFEESAAKAH